MGIEAPADSGIGRGIAWIHVVRTQWVISSNPSWPRPEHGFPSARTRAHYVLCRSAVDVRSSALGRQAPPTVAPAGCAWDGKQHRKHLWLEAHGLVDGPGVKVHVGIQLALDEVVVFQGNPLQLQGDIQLWIAPRYLDLA